MTQKSKEIANHYAGKLCKLHTLRGEEKAKVTGRLNEYATVASLESGLTATFSWQAIQRKMESDKLFYAC